MQKLRVVILPLFFYLHVCAMTSEIKVIKSYAEAQEVLNVAGPETLVLFDVDETLTVPRSPMFRSGNEQWLAKSMSSIGVTQLDNWSDIVLNDSVPLLIENGIPALIKSLQKRNVLVLALTAIITGSESESYDMPEWRYAKLKAHDIDFMHPNLSEKCIFSKFPVKNGHRPMLYKGILCSAYESKGAVLSAFLDDTELQPRCVIFFDDIYGRVHQVQQAILKRNIDAENKISFHGYHYLGAACVASELDEELGRFQLKYLADNQIWLDEDQARVLLTQKNQK